VDLHAEQIQGFFDIPVDHLTAFPVIARYVRELNIPDTVIVSPDVGNLKKSKAFATVLGSEIAVIDKRRKTGDAVEMTTIIGNVAGKNVLLFDDMLATGGTMQKAADIVRRNGAKKVYAGVTHGVFAGQCVQRLKEGEFEEIWVTDTIPVREDIQKELTNLRILPVGQLVGEAIRRIHRHESISALFNDD
jgi:ribose-phosphate pyrophosphokinase